MADNVRVDSVRNLVGEQSIQYIRPITIQLSLFDARPNSRMYVFFGRENVSHLCGLVGSAQNTPLLTDAEGKAVINLNLPGGRFNAGDYEIIVADTNDLALLETTGSVYGSARARFSSKGTVRYYQTTKTTVTTVTKTVVTSDPLAQSFFTTGVPDGIFVSSIDLFFQTKDSTIPVSVDIRPLVNGYPLGTRLPHKNFVSYVSAANVNVSTNATQSTKFVFDPPVYLQGDSDFCFVVFSNSKEYNLFTSRVGERSNETGTIIFDQPYVGSLFKSENNITWTAEQFEDIKFRINRAEFDTGVSSTIDFGVTSPNTASYGEQFVTTNNSSIIRYTHEQKHGLEVGSHISLFTRSDCTYNGIPSANLVGDFQITSVIDGYTVEFDCGTKAKANGQITSSNGVVFVYVQDGGINYSNTSTTISFTGGGGTNANAVPVIVDGVIKEINIANTGSGYNTNPTVVITSPTGSGASAIASVTAMFAVELNKPYQVFTPNLKVYNFGSSKTTSQIQTTTGNYEGGALTPYLQGKSLKFGTDQFYVDLKQNTLLASRKNESSIMGGNRSAKISVQLSSGDSKVSPIIDVISSYPEVLLFNKKISSNTTNETSAGNGFAQCRYLTRPISLQTVSKGIRLFSKIISYPTTSVDWYVKTSLSSSGVVHDDQPWQLLVCPENRSKSGDLNEVFEYQFSLDSINDFDTYSLKCIMTATDPSRSPIVVSYRAIIVL